MRCFVYHTLFVVDEQNEREAEGNTEETIGLLKKQGLWKESEAASFSTRISVLLVLPLLQSQSQFDSNLSGATASVLFGCLQECPPLSLYKEPSDCLNGLENLLCSWLGEGSQQGVKDFHQRQNIASALVALACAWGNLKTIIHTVHLLNRLQDVKPLPVSDTLLKLLHTEGGQSQSNFLLGPKHVICWGFDDMLANTEKENDKETEVDIGRHTTCDGLHLYTTNCCGKGLAKIGTGLHGSLRGFVYVKNTSIGPGHVAWADGSLYMRPAVYDGDKQDNAFLQVIDPHTLQVTKTLPRPAQYNVSSPMTTIALCSDGSHLYWIWCAGVMSDKTAKGMDVFVDTFKVVDKVIIPLKACIKLQRKDEAAAKTMNETLLTRLRPYRSASHAATLVALTSSENGRKEEAGSTSCGIVLSNLIKTPVYCDGNSVVMVTPVPGSGGNNVSRSLFGSGATLSSLRTLAGCVVFNLSNGSYSSRTDLVDAITCGLARGAPVLGLGICYDVKNNMLWTCGNDWVDQFVNPGHQAKHHVLSTLGIEDKTEDSKAESGLGSMEVGQVIKSLLQHAGCVCVHQLNSDILHTPLGNLLMQQTPADSVHLGRVADVLEWALANQDSQIIHCILMVVQLVSKVNTFNSGNEKEVISRLSDLLWQTLNSYEVVDSNEGRAITEKACNALCIGINIFYSTEADRNNLLFQLLTEGENRSGMKHLRELILIEYAEQLRNNALETDSVKKIRLPETMVKYIVKLAVKESSILLSKCHTLGLADLEMLLSTLPVSSPYVRYLTAMQCHMLREVMLLKVRDDAVEEDSAKLQRLQMSVLSLSSTILSSTFQVLEILLESCNTIITSKSGDIEYRLQGLERVAKGTILGHLLPVLVTSLTHANLRCLTLADSLMPQLVQLVLLTSRAALRLKSQVHAIEEESLLDDDQDIVELIGQSLNPDSLNEAEEQGFLAGLKIPAPWATGKSVETIHPVRDNYKFKETVTIPGARCLYLRFDPRSSSQYDYDKVILYAGTNTNSRKVGEYGGNTLGYGSRSVLGSGWPKDLVKVDGDSVTLSFEMRSGREHNTPDKAMWGFLVTVRAQESGEDVSSGLPFLADLALSLSVLGCSMLNLLYQGPDTTKEETTCSHLLKSKLLQRCVWQSRPLGSPVKTKPPVDLPSSDSSLLKTPIVQDSLPRIKLPSDILVKLRELSGCVAPQIRPSIKEVIQVDVIEECVISATVKHISLSSSLHNLTSLIEQQTDEYWLLCSVMAELFRRTDALVRQLQSLADLEQRWQNEVEEIQQGQSKTSAAFFMEFHLIEGKEKELALLCYLKDIELDLANTEAAVSSLRECLEADSELSQSRETSLSMYKTRMLVSGLLERLDLLLHVNIELESGTPPPMFRATSHFLDVNKEANVMIRSDTDVLKMFRSHSQPADVLSSQDDSIVDIMRLQRRRQAQKKGPVSILQDLMHGVSSKDQPPHVQLIDQLFTFFGSNPEKAVSCKSFLMAAQVRWKRGLTRKQALVHMKELLTAASRVGGATHLVAAVTSVLQHGPRIEELTCGGMVHEVREAFSETMTAVVQLTARYPLACANSIGLLCIIPYTRAEEKCLVRCGLVHLLDRLCSLSNYRGDNTNNQSLRQRVAAMAWAGFQVLSNRCVMWEHDGAHFTEELEHSGLARQVSVLLTNHLARATECSGCESAGSEALQEVLSLLNELSRSKMGKAILCQPACVSKLLSLLLDQRPSPKLVLVILQLCRVALPLMSAEDCANVRLPIWSHDVQVEFTDPASKIASLLLYKLGDFLVPGGTAVTVSRDMSIDVCTVQGASGIDKDKADEDIQDGRLSVFVHRREDQSSHEVIQSLLSSDNRPLRLGAGANMERVVKMDREMSKHCRAEVTTEDAMSAWRRAARWAQMGLVVSTGAPVESAPVDSSLDKRKTGSEVVCKEKNSELVRSDPVRPFISGHVANSMASEVIALLHSLLSSAETAAAQIWASAVQKVLSSTLSNLPDLVDIIDNLTSPDIGVDNLMTVTKQINATLCALGGFRESVKPGCHVEVVGEHLHNTKGIVLNISENTGVATVQLNAVDENYPEMRYSSIVEVPTKRLRTLQNEPLPLERLSMTDDIVKALHSLLLPTSGNSSPLTQPLTVIDDGNSLSNQVCRVLAELRTRACMVLSTHLKDISFAQTFIQHSGDSIQVLKSLAKDINPGDRQQVVEGQCEKLRMLYRDCAKPPPPPSKVITRNNKEITWCPNRSFPPVRACLFSHGVTGITFLGDPSAGSGLPRGTFIYASQAVPQQAPSFYFEIEICSFGDQHEDSSPIMSFGFAPNAERKDGAWTNPVGTCLFHNNGRAVHYNGASLLQWKSIRLDVCLSVGDTAGCGWERTGEVPIVASQQAKGRVYFTHNGRRIAMPLEDVSGGMWPVVHIQKKSTRIKTNFGQRPFMYAKGQNHHEIATADLARENRDFFSLLPFHNASESDIEARSLSPGSSSSNHLDVTHGTACRVALPPKGFKEYSSDSSQYFKRLEGYDGFVRSGPDTHGVQGIQENESDCEPIEEEEITEDHHALLIKAWEQKVFPTIRRRFRNEAERKDGLEQIRGALQLGMTDIARQTVEFLYEENGGMPRDLHLPTIEDIREDLAKFTIERVRRGTAVVVRNITSTGPGTVLPRYAVRGMLKTFGQTGTVLDVDTLNELVQVETYLRSEGVLVRYWYPLWMLERPPQGYRKMGINGMQAIDTSNVQIHRELLRCEGVLARMFCRTALLELIHQCNSPAMEVASCSANLSSGMAACTAVLQELDIENLQVLSNELISPPQIQGSVVSSSLATSQSPSLCLNVNSCLMSDAFYHNPDNLKRELSVAIARAANQGEDLIIELSTLLCSCLQTSPEMFPVEELPVNESKVSTDFHFPGAAFLVVSCVTDPKTMKKITTPYRSPWARVFTYTGHSIKKNGQSAKQEVVTYPRVASVQNAIEDPLAPVIIPGNYIHVKVGVSPPPGIIMTIHGIPAQFPLAVAYMETLVSEKYQFRLPGAEVAADDKGSIDIISSAALHHVTELLCGYLWRTDTPAILRESMFHLLAQSLRLLHKKESGVSSMMSSFGVHLSPSMSLLLQLQTELRKLYDEETKTWPSSGSVSGVGIGVGIGDHGRFSTYFHSLMEVSLAIAEITSPGTPGGLLAGPSSPTGGAGAEAPPIPSSPISAKRKKLKREAKRDRVTPKKLLSPSESESPSKVGSSSSSTSVSSDDSVKTSGHKPEDMLWFNRAFTMSQILRFITFSECQGKTFTDDAISDASQSLMLPTAHTRLLVLNNIPGTMSRDALKSTLLKACNSIGGLFRDELFIPNSCFNAHLQDTSSSEEQAAASASVESETKSSSESEHHSYAVVEIRSRTKLEAARTALTQTLTAAVASLKQDGADEQTVAVNVVNQNLFTDLPGNPALEHYLVDKLLCKNSEFTEKARVVLTDIFHSCYILEQLLNLCEDDTGYIALNHEQICTQLPANLLCTFFSNIKPAKKSLSEQASAVLRKYGIPQLNDKPDSSDKGGKKAKKSPRSSKEKMALSASSSKTSHRDAARKSKSKEHADSEKVTKEHADVVTKLESTDKHMLTLDGFLQFVLERCQQDPRVVWRALLACGYDFHFDRFSCLDTVQAQRMSEHWNLDKDSALVQYINSLCQHLAVSPSRLHPHEVYVTDSQLTSESYLCLKDIPVESLRLRFALLQSLNSSLETFFLPLVDLRSTQSFTRSTGALLARARHVIFYDTKTVFLNRVLNATTQRRPDQAAPEIILDPLETIGGDRASMVDTVFCQAFRQLSAVPSDQLCVRIASGGDPTYSFNVRLTGEEVHGTSGSFRHFLWQIAKELQSSQLDLLIPCPSSTVHRNQGKYILKPGKMTFPEENLLQFFGQLLGVAIRADIPLGLNLLPTFWKSLVLLPLDPVVDLKEADILTYNYIKKFEMVESESELQALCAENYPRFAYTTMSGDEIEMKPGGYNTFVCWENRHAYVKAIRELRMSELQCSERIMAVRIGLATVIPLQLTSLQSSLDIELRTCGRPEVDLNFLKTHTMYQVGLTPSDKHVELFWTALESFSQEELCKFIKFACNQDRIPQSCPCRDGGSDTAHVPPYPLKIAPPDGTGSPDSRYIRVETCMFMIKLPQYSSLEIMKEKLHYAIHCREDPLSG